MIGPCCEMTYASYLEEDGDTVDKDALQKELDRLKEECPKQYDSLKKKAGTEENLTAEDYLKLNPRQSCHKRAPEGICKCMCHVKGVRVFH